MRYSVEESATILKTDSNSRTEKHAGERIIAVLRRSVIISALDRFCLKIYDLLCSGMFAKLFSRERRTPITESIRRPKAGTFTERAKDKLSEKIECSKIVNAVSSLSGRLLSIRLHIIGTYLMSFAAYTVLFALIAGFLNNNVSGRYALYLRLTEALTVAALSVPLLASKHTLSNILCSSRICRFFTNAAGFSVDNLSVSGESGKFAPAFVLGILSGAASLVISPLYILLAILAVIYLYIVLSTPEFGLLSLFFLMPFAPTMVLAGLTIFTDAAFFIKLIRRKRVFHFGRVDLVALLFAVLMLAGGFISLSTGSIPPALMYVCFLSAYFQVSCCVRSEKWLIKCMTAMVFSALITAFYGIIQYVIGNTMNSAWIDSDLFEGIDGRATATLENPNMLGEYLIMVIPIAASMWMAGISMRRKNSFCSLACMAMCLILTWSRGAWLGFLFSFAVLLLIWNRRSIWLFLCGIAALPLISVALPNTIVSRFTSIGNLADTSTSYRLGIWRGAVHMLKDIFMSGIGVGSAAWNRIYSNYSLAGITRADHSHNLFLQIAIDIGIPGLIVFLTLMILFARCAFTTIRHISGSPTEENSSLTPYQHKMAIAGPLCGIFAVLIQGLTDYSWYNYRVYLMFWLVAGLIPALAKNARRAADAEIGNTPKCEASEASIDIKLAE